jgi:predicted aldo/keto reductase-like oxidoreductase
VTLFLFTDLLYNYINFPLQSFNLYSKYEELKMKKSKISRRRFLKSTSISFLGAGLLGRNCLAITNADNKNELPKKLVYRTLGKTGIQVPVIGMGILDSGSSLLIKAALDAGITHFDSTAGGASQMRNEEMIGEVMKGRPRDTFIYGTKIHLPRDYKTGLYTDLYKGTAGEQEFTRKLDEALKRLQMEYVDIVYHHMVSRRESAFYEPVMKAMEKAKKAGKARFLGMSSHSNVPEAVQAAADSEFYDVVMAAYNPRQKNRVQVKEAIANAARAGLGVVVIKVIRGDIERGEKPVNPVASLKWVLQDKNVHATIPGFSNYEEMKIDLSVMEDLSLSDVEMNDLKREDSCSGLFCEGCGQCIQQCPAELPIPDLMRAYMYLYGYRQPGLAHSLLKSLDLPRNYCDDCSSCRVVCQNGWNISEKICDIIRLRDVPPDFLV